MIDLDWIAKPFGPGDIAGDGTKKLLGTSVATPSLLLRETAQNSWDARLVDEVPEYQMRFRRIGGEVIGVLRDHVFTGTSPSSGLAEVLRSPGVEAIEIHDRGTSGLDGPTNNDSQVDEGEPTNYRDFVLTVGAPRSRTLGGGTYGFGKAAAFRASTCGTLVIWTRILIAPGQFEERLIAAAVNPNFQLGNRRYTGQQWWGVRPQGDDSSVVQPVRGAEARAIGEAIFERTFAPGETGTSLLVLSPAYEDGRDSFISETRAAVPINLWTKRLSNQASSRRMNISLTVDGEPIHIADSKDSRVIAAKEACLQAVRHAQAVGDGVEASAEVDPSVTVEEIWCRSPRTLVGHLAVTPCAVPPGDPFKSHENRVTLMRNQAELVVEDREYPSYRNMIGEWVGVFKPVRELDSAFSASEPPTHDSWNPNSLESAHKRLVNTGLRRIGEEVRTFLAPADAVEDEPQESTSQLAAALGVLSRPVAGRSASAAPRPGRQSRDVKARTSKVEVTGYELVPPSEDGDPSTAITRITLLARSDGEYVRVTPKLDIGIDGRNSLGDPDEVYIGSWTTSEGVKYDGDGIRVRSGETFTVDVCYPDGVAIDCTFLGEDA
ncbi:hypothetical protein [Acidipropionibacterium acidipropionici]|uniref:hypothetical protein n=1 Tax=Acidipropionibacterium acidipropionici TaxID=1748 RepID=UPI00041CA7DA|nr:hypothetical protein [Acidipropionibacterium acidipropionici]ALN15208.1 hypothetical protein ASQ49_07910 [Acidipropionibacterium acidipropionici]APZ09042.1 hypothetical protein BWX38_07010 [Acidipropionibacterium acidipropionici]